MYVHVFGYGVIVCVVCLGIAVARSQLVVPRWLLSCLRVLCIVLLNVMLKITLPMYVHVFGYGVIMFVVCLGIAVACSQLVVRSWWLSCLRIVQLFAADCDTKTNQSNECICCSVWCECVYCLLGVAFGSSQLTVHSCLLLCC